MGNEPSKVSYSAMLAALIAAIAVSSIWYSPLLFGKLWRELNGTNLAGPANTTIHAWRILIDLVREFFVIYVLARLVDGLGIVDWKGGLNAPYRNYSCQVASCPDGSTSNVIIVAEQDAAANQ